MLQMEDGVIFINEFSIFDSIAAIEIRYFQVTGLSDAN